MRSPIATAPMPPPRQERETKIEAPGFYSSITVGWAPRLPRSETVSTPVYDRSDGLLVREPDLTGAEDEAHPANSRAVAVSETPSAAVLVNHGWTQRQLEVAANVADPAMTRIVLIVDQPLVRDGIGSLVERAGGIALVDSIPVGVRALKRVQQLRPDVVVLDIGAQDANGLLLVQRLVGEASCRLVVLSAYEDKAYVQRALQVGANAYVSKRSPPDHLLQAIRAVASGGLYVDPILAHHLVADRARPRGDGQTPSFQSLTARETEVIRSIALGYTTKEIAAQLGVTAKTVETHKARAREKLGMRSRMQLVQYASSMGWLSRR